MARCALAVIARPLPLVWSTAKRISDLYYEAPPVKEFRKKFKLKKLGGTKPLLAAMLKAYKDFGGRQKKPNIAIVEFRQPHSSASDENALLAEFFTREGYPTEVISPDQLEYRNNLLRRGEFNIDLVYRQVRLQEFLVRFDLNHPFVRAYKDRAVCMVNSFRAEMGSKMALFDLLTDEAVTAKFPAAERKAIKDYVPWTRVVQAAKTTHKNHTVDLPDFVMKHRAKLVLRPNDDSTGSASGARRGRDRARMGEGSAPGHAHALRGAGSLRAGSRRLPDAAVRQPDDEGNAGGRSAARVSGRGARMLQLAGSGGRVFVLHADRARADVLARRANKRPSGRFLAAGRGFLGLFVDDDLLEVFGFKDLIAI